MSAGSGGAVAGSGGAAAATGGAGGVSTGGAPGDPTGGMTGSVTDAAVTDAPVTDASVMDAAATDASATDAAVIDASPQFFEAQTLAIASEYLAWGRIDDELRWAPSLCRQPLPGVAHSSASNDPATHGQKLYSVFAKHRDNYPAGPHADQVVVKQSWKTELVDDPDASYNPGGWRPDSDGGDHFYPYARNDGGVYRATEPAGLFVMFKLDPATPETDEGWVYATVSPAGEVTSSGRVASCMGCHEASATHERLYGVSKDP
jgi:hypothetical protein